MSELSPDGSPVHEVRHDHEQEQAGAVMPRWVPLAIGAVLVTLAALAVLTGLRYRDQTLVNIIRPQSEARRNSGGPPGEPEAGASLVFPGEAGANVPAANAPYEGETRATIQGGPDGVTSVIRMTARRGMVITSSPADAVVYVNDVAVGQARQFDSEDEVYDFPAAGSYDVKIVAPGFEQRHFVVTVSDAAERDIVRIDVKLDKALKR